MTPSKIQYRFRLPQKGTLQPNSIDDPLPYYYKPLVGKIYCARIEQGLNLLKPPYDSILEMGYGSGLLLPSLYRMTESLSGIDLSSDPQQVKEDLTKLGVHCTLVQGDVANDHFQGKRFELIVAMSIFEHIDHLRPVIDRIYKLLTPKGQLLVGMPRVDPIMDKAFRLIGYNNINDHHVTDHKECIRVTTQKFDLINSSSLPVWLPDIGGLYFNMLFQKPI